MSVDYRTCESCEQAVYEEYIGRCTNCGHNLCTKCVINDDVESNYACDYGVRYDGSEEQRKKYEIEQDEWEPIIGDVIDDTSIQPKYCPFCNGLIVDENDLIDFACEKLDTTKVGLVEMYRIAKFEEEPKCQK